MYFKFVNLIHFRFRDWYEFNSLIYFNILIYIIIRPYHMAPTWPLRWYDQIKNIGSVNMIGLGLRKFLIKFDLVLRNFSPKPT